MPHVELRVRTLYMRRRRLHVALADMERREAVIRKNIADVEAELHARPVRAAATSEQASGDLRARLLDYLRECDAPQSTREIALWVMREKGVEVVGVRQLQGFINRV